MLLYTTVVTIKVKSILSFFTLYHFLVHLLTFVLSSFLAVCPFLHKYTERKEAGVKFLVYRYLANKANFVSENFDSGKKQNTHSQWWSIKSVILAH